MTEEPTVQKGLKNMLKLLDDPVLTKIVGAVLTILAVIAIVQGVKWVATRYIDDKAVRYRARKVVGFLG